jgi:hypothetical protein
MKLLLQGQKMGWHLTPEWMREQQISEVKRQLFVFSLIIQKYVM